MLQTREGYPILGKNGKPIQIDPSIPFTVSPQGEILQGGSAAGQLEVLDVESVDRLTKRGGSYFALSAGGKTAPVTAPEVQQGKIEASNVEPSQAAVKLVGVLRQFEVMQKAVRIAGDMGKQAVEQVAKVS